MVPHELPNGLSMLTPCFKAGILITHPWSFSEELILYMMFFHIPEMNYHQKKGWLGVKAAKSTTKWLDSGTFRGFETR